MASFPSTTLLVPETTDERAVMTASVRNATELNKRMYDDKEKLHKELEEASKAAANVPILEEKLESMRSEAAESVKTANELRDELEKEKKHANELRDELEKEKKHARESIQSRLKEISTLKHNLSENDRYHQSERKKLRSEIKVATFCLGKQTRVLSAAITKSLGGQHLPNKQSVQNLVDVLIRNHEKVSPDIPHV